jgi:hypothetical protein
MADNRSEFPAIFLGSIASGTHSFGVAGSFASTQAYLAILFCLTAFTRMDSLRSSPWESKFRLSFPSIARVVSPRIAG